MLSKQESWSALLFGAALFLAGCSPASQDVEAAPLSGIVSPEPSASDSPEAKPQPEAEADRESTTSCATLGVTVAELPERWNAYIDESGSGFTLPDPISATGTSIFGLSQYTQYLDSTRSALSAINVYWHPSSGQVQEVTIYGDVATSADLTLSLTNTAGAMVFAATEKTLAEAEAFLVNRLMTGVNSLEPGGFIIELVEEDDRAFRFNVAGGGADWSAVGSRPCP